MARRRFFVDQVRSQHAEIAGEDAHHLTRVLRVAAGERYEISDNHSVWLAEVTEAGKSRVVFSVLGAIPPRPLPVRITLLAALVKFDRFEWILEKATEAGVERFVPVVTERCEKGLDRAAGKRRARWERILVESSQQCRRDRLPALDDPLPLARALLCGGHRFVLDEAPDAPPILASLPPAAGRSPEDQLALLVGPEGGWSDRERTQIRDAGWAPVTLGPLVLRSETAALAGAAILSAAWQGLV